MCFSVSVVVRLVAWISHLTANIPCSSTHQLSFIPREKCWGLFREKIEKQFEYVHKFYFECMTFRQTPYTKKSTFSNGIIWKACCLYRHHHQVALKLETKVVWFPSVLFVCLNFWIYKWEFPYVFGCFKVIFFETLSW